MADAKLTAISAVSVPDLADLLYLVDVSDTTDDAAGSSRQVALYRALGLLNHVCQFRLTLSTGVPVTTSDVTGATAIKWTPYNGNLVAVYDGTRWKLYSSAELSLSLGTLTSGANYDAFLYDNAGTLTLVKGPAWSSDTSRGTGAGTTELDTQDGVYVNKVSLSGGPGAKAGRYLGTFRTTGTTTTEDSAANRFVWNAYNRTQRPAVVTDSTSSWTLAASSVWSQRGSKQFAAVVGLAGAGVNLLLSVVASAGSPGSSSAGVAIGVDSTSTAAGTCGQTNYVTSVFAALARAETVGYHYYAWLENAGVATATFYGALTSPTRTSGITGYIEG